MIQYIWIDACRESEECCNLCHNHEHDDYDNDDNDRFTHSYRAVGEKRYVFKTCCKQYRPTEKEMDDLILKSGR